MRLKHAIALVATEDRGYSLIELLVAMLGATVVAGALFAVLIFSTNQTTTLTDKVQADQLGRIAMTRIVDELNSSCLTTSFAPVQEQSNGSELYFINAYTNESVVSKAQLHQIVWSPTAKTLTDYHVESNPGNPPTFTFPRLEPTSPHQLIASNVTQNGTTPIFQYYTYAAEATESGTTPTGSLTEELKPTTVGSTVALGKANAEKTASVLVSFTTAPSDGKTTLNRALVLSNQVTFAFSVPNASTPISDGPCQ